MSNAAVDGAAATARLPERRAQALITLKAAIAAFLVLQSIVKAYCIVRHSHLWSSRRLNWKLHDHYEEVLKALASSAQPCTGRRHNEGSADLGEQTDDCGECNVVYVDDVAGHKSRHFVAGARSFGRVAVVALITFTAHVMRMNLILPLNRRVLLARLIVWIRAWLWGRSTPQG